MRATWIVGITVLGWLLVGCQSESRVGGGAQIFPQEADPLFHSGSRLVVQPEGDDQQWVLYYFENESLETLSSKLTSAAFYKEEGWSDLRPDKGITGFTTGRKGVPKGGLSLLALTPGKLARNLIDTESASGASLLLVPSSRS
jgi:hypothetical protein